MLFDIPAGSAVIFTSDGIVEAQNREGELFGFERLERTILEIVHTGAATPIVNHIIHTVQTFTAEQEQGDDMTVVVIVVQ